MVTIVIPVHNAIECTARLLDQLKQTEAADVAQILVDDASDRETHDVLVKYVSEVPNASLLVNDRQQLFTRTLNRGIRAAQPDTTAIVEINTDCQVKPGFLQALVDCFNRHPDSAIVGYNNYTPTEGEDLEAIYPAVQDHPDYITGHCILIPMDVIRDIGVFCETDYSQAHISSERLWCWKAALQGYKMWYLNSNLCIHDEGGPSWGRNVAWLFYKFDYSTLWPGRDTL
jgi:GT2 family glycosyltransferase